MYLIDRYLHEIGRYLPRKNRVDIQTELRSLIMDALEARVQGEASEDDVVALLKEFGPPEKVAASYWPEGQYLIGPALFPTFRMVVGISLAVLVGVHILVFALNLALGQEMRTAANLLADFFGSALSMLGVIVVVFYILQLLDVRARESNKDWDPRTLPTLEESEIVKRGEIIFEIVFGLVFLGLLLAFPGRVALTASAGSRMIIADPVITAYLPLIAIILVLGLGLDVILLWQGRWQFSTRLAKVLIELFGIGVLGLLIVQHNAWLEARTAGDFFGFLRTLPQGSIPDPETVQILVMHSVRISLFIALVVTAVEFAKQVYGLIRRIIETGATPQLITLQQTDLGRSGRK